MSVGRPSERVGRPSSVPRMSIGCLLDVRQMWRTSDVTNVFLSSNGVLECLVKNLRPYLGQDLGGSGLGSWALGAQIIILLDYIIDFVWGVIEGSVVGLGGHMPTPILITPYPTSCEWQILMILLWDNETNQWIPYPDSKIVSNLSRPLLRFRSIFLDIFFQRELLPLW